MYRVILFDLDGTLTDSGEGITKSVQYAIEKLGMGEYPLEQLRSFVGPPLMEQFMSFCDISQERAREAVQYYRERYSLVGLYENRPYDGIQKLLKELKEQGYLLGVASSKPEYFVDKILKYFSLDSYFDAVVGSELSGQRTSKAEVVEEALRRLGVSDRRQEVVLVGDRKYDVIGARAMGIDCVAVSYGYGDMQELMEVHPVYIAKSAEELADFFGLSL
ncbi:MAG: HAD-IA family hydrolase [Eubacteriales bacterium]|nr:HAD-IA family hydrolase [Eubacteriales bacterium]